MEVAPVAYKELADKKEQSKTNFTDNIQDNNIFTHLLMNVKYIAIIAFILLALLLIIMVF